MTAGDEHTAAEVRSFDVTEGEGKFQVYGEGF